jgi:hypothetical protein
VPHAREQHRGGRLLDDPPAVHHGDLVGPPGDHAEVVGHQHHGHVAVGLVVLQQVQDLGLHRDVERRCRLVGEQQLRPARQRQRDHHPLPHAPREQMRVLREPPLGLGDPDRTQQGDRREPRLLPAHPRLEPQGLGDLLADGHDRVERAQRVLEHHRDLVAEQRAHLAVVQPHQLATHELHAAGATDVDLGQQVHDRAGQDRLPRPRLAHHTQRPAAIEREADTVDGLDPAPRRQEVGLQVVDIEQHARRRRSSHGRLDVEAQRDPPLPDVPRS